ncbi:hypothetical protein LTS10_000478 [Elasticomyces elasticus]|nr:hypothetical protein LTS10_000478 [Elasticomyces elasticus]
MSTQPDDGFTFSILPEEQREHFRLLELPPELLELVTSNTSHTVLSTRIITDGNDRLQFKSADGQHTGKSGSVPEAYICISDKTYKIRQVNSSNSVYICQPANNDDDNGLPQAGLQAIAQSSWTLELNQAQENFAIQHLKAMLPTYSSTGSYQSKDLASKQRIFDNIPSSQAQCEQAWKDLACFELSDPQGCFLPSASVKVQVWRSMLDQAVASGVDLTGDLSQQQLDVINDPNEEWPTEIGPALLNSILNGEGRVDESKCVTSAGVDLLAARLGVVQPTAEFLAIWRNALPEKWRAEAKVEMLHRTEYRLGDSRKTIAYAGAKGTAAVADGDATTGAKRKWHDKFRASKKAA